MAVGDGARWGKESLFKISSPTWGDLILNDMSSANRHRITQIDGLFSDPDIRDQREAAPGDHGEVRLGGRALFSGKTIVIRGMTEAIDMHTLRMMQRQMKRVTNELIGPEKPLLIYSDQRWYDQNLLTDPAFEIATTVWTLTNPAGVTGITTGRVARVIAGGSGTQAYRLSYTKDATATNRQQWIGSPTGLNGMKVTPKQAYTLTALVEHVNAPAIGTRVQIAWYKADGSPASTPMSYGLDTGGNVNAIHKPTVTATAPDDAAFASAYVMNTTATASDIVDTYVGWVMFQPGSKFNGYFDGEYPGYSWDGARYNSKSTSMRSAQINVAKNQPLIMDERQENLKLEREFVLTLRATNPRILGQYLETQTFAMVGTMLVAATIRNEGDSPAQISARFNGAMAVNPNLQNLTTAKTLQTLQGALTAGQYTDFAWDGPVKKILDQMGAARPSRFDPITASWLEALVGDNSMRVQLTANGGAGASVVASWRDTWM